MEEQKAKKKPVVDIYVYRDEQGQIRYRGYDEDHHVVASPKTTYRNRMAAAEILKTRHPKARIYFSIPRHLSVDG